MVSLSLPPRASSFGQSARYVAPGRVLLTPRALVVFYQLSYSCAETRGLPQHTLITYIYTSLH